MPHRHISPTFDFCIILHIFSPLGTNFNNPTLGSSAKTNDSHFVNANLQNNMASFQNHSSSGLDPTSLNNPIQSNKNSLPPSSRTGGGDSDDAGQGTDMMKMYSYGPLAINGNANSSGTYPSAVSAILHFFLIIVINGIILCM